MTHRRCNASHPPSCAGMWSGIAWQHQHESACAHNLLPGWIDRFEHSWDPLGFRLRSSDCVGYEAPRNHACGPPEYEDKLISQCPKRHPAIGSSRMSRRGRQQAHRTRQSWRNSPPKKQNRRERIGHVLRKTCKAKLFSKDLGANAVTSVVPKPALCLDFLHS